VCLTRLVAWVLIEASLDLIDDLSEVPGLRRLQRWICLVRLKFIQPQLLTEGQHVPVVLIGGARGTQRTTHAHGRLLLDADILLERITLDVLDQGEVERDEGQAGAIKKTRRSHFVITERGQKLLAQCPDRIDISVLRQFPEFVEFRENPSEETTSGAFVPNCIGSNQPRAMEWGNAISQVGLPLISWRSSELGARDRLSEHAQTV